MTDSDSKTELDWRSPLAAVLLASGILLVLLSLFWPSGGVAHSNWSPEQAKKYQEASVKLHSLSHASVHSSSEVDQAAMRKDLQQAEAEYNAIRTKLDSAIDQPKRFSHMLRWTGIALMAVGGWGLYRLRAPATP